MTNSHQGLEEPAVSYELSPSESPSEAVVAAVSAASGAEPLADCDDATEVLDPLYSAVDPDALDCIFGATGPGEARTGCRVTFDYHGHEVTVHGDRVTVERPGSASD